MHSGCCTRGNPTQVGLYRLDAGSMATLLAVPGVIKFTHDNRENADIQPIFIRLDILAL